MCSDGSVGVQKGVEVMKNTAKVVAVAGGVTAIIAAATKAEKAREWREVHKVAAAAGLVLAVVGIFA